MGVKTVLGIKKKRGKMCRDLGNKNDGKIFKTLGIGEVEKIVGIEEKLRMWEKGHPIIIVV